MGCSGPNLRSLSESLQFEKMISLTLTLPSWAHFHHIFRYPGIFGRGVTSQPGTMWLCGVFGGGWNCDVAKISMKTFVTKKVMVYWKACQLLCLFQNVFRSRGYLERSSRHYSTLPGSAGSRRVDGIQMRLRSQWKTIVTTQVIAHWKARHMLSSFPSSF